MIKSSGTTFTGGLPTVSRRALGGLTAGAGAAALLPWPLSPAQAETAINWMSWQGYDECYHTGSYLEDNDIEFNATYVNANEEIITKLNAGGVGNYDTSIIYFGFVKLMAQAGLLEPIDESRIEVLTNGTIMPEFANLEALRWDGQLWGLPWTWGSGPLVYDPAATAAPESWLDLWSEEYRGKIAMLNDPLGNLMIYGKVIGGAEVPTIITHEQLQKTIDGLIDMKNNYARAVAVSFGEAADMFARGEVTVMNVGWEAMIGFCAEKGKVVDITFPKEGTYMFLDCLIIPKDSPHPDIAYDLTNLCLGKQAQIDLAASLGQAVVNLEAAMEVSQENRDMYGYDHMTEIAEKIHLYPMPPTESDGVHATMDDIFAEFERFMQA